MKIELELNNPEIKEAIIKRITEHMSWEQRQKFEGMVTEAMRLIDQPTVNRMVTEFLIAEQLGKLRAEEKRK